MNIFKHFIKLNISLIPSNQERMSAAAIPSSKSNCGDPLTISILKPDEGDYEIPMVDEVQLNDITLMSDPFSGGGKDEDGQKGGGGGMASDGTGKKGKIGHRRIDKQGEVSYKRVPTNALMGAIQLGIANSVGSLASKAKRDILVQDFEVIESVAFPSDGSQITPSHQYGDFRFKTYAPIAFRYFRELFNIKPVDFLKSLCTQPLRELSNPGASGSIFYVSMDDRFIIKTVQHKEAEFLRKLLPGYYMNLHQNPRTFLPKFFGLFCYQSLGKNIRLLVMNNLLPQSIEMHHKFDLKGSTYKRYASKSEQEKSSPTLKDLDFNQEFKDGIIMDAHIYDILVDVIKRDCLVLESFKIMDYSLLMGVHNIDQATSSRQVAWGGEETTAETWRSLQMDFSSTRGPHDDGGVPAKNAKGDRLLLYLGVIDILQSYRLFKKLEHSWKSILHDGETISVTNPAFYASRFISYISTTVFRRAQADSMSARHTANKFRSLVHSYIAMKSTTPLRHPSSQVQQQRIRGISAADYSTMMDHQNGQQTPIGRQQQRGGSEYHHREEIDGSGASQPPLSQRGTLERRSFFIAKTPTSGTTTGAGQSSNEFEKRKKVERLFASKKDRDENENIHGADRRLQSTQV